MSEASYVSQTLVASPPQVVLVKNNIDASLASVIEKKGGLNDHKKEKTGFDVFFLLRLPCAFIALFYLAFPRT
jgi:hypothetical protein